MELKRTDTPGPPFPPSPSRLPVINPKCVKSSWLLKDAVNCKMFLLSHFLHLFPCFFSSSSKAFPHLPFYPTSFFFFSAPPLPSLPPIPSLTTLPSPCSPALHHLTFLLPPFPTPPASLSFPSLPFYSLFSHFTSPATNLTFLSPRPSTPPASILL